MKILQIIQRPQLRGAELFTAQLCEHLIKLGHQCVLISLYNGSVKLPFSGRIIKLNRYVKFRLFDFFGWKALNKIIEQEMPSIVQVNGADTLKFAVFSKILFGWPQPLVYRNTNMTSYFIDTRIKYLFNNFLLSHVNHVVSVSDICTVDFINLYSYPTARISTIEIGIDTIQFTPCSEDIKLIRSQGPIILNVAEMVPEKNQKGLLRIFGKILATIPSAQLIILGKGILQAELKQLATQLNIISSVHFLGARTDVLAIMKQSQVFLLTSHIEGLPGVILEAMYASCPVVAYGVGGIGEVIDSNETGMLIPKDEEETFVQAVLTVLENKAISDHLTTKAFELVITRFDNRKITKRFIDVYNQLLQA